MAKVACVFDICLTLQIGQGCKLTGTHFVCKPAGYLGVEHHALNLSKDSRVQGAWHIQNANGYHSRLKHWMRRFKGVASSYLASYLGGFRAIDRPTQSPRQPAPFLALAVGL